MACPFFFGISAFISVHVEIGLIGIGEEEHALRCSRTVFAIHVAFGQRILYNSDLDKSGQAAVAAGKAIASDTVTSKELTNLALIEKGQIEGVLASGLITARRFVETLSDWQSVPSSANFICELILDDPLREWEISKASILLKRSPSIDTDCKVLTDLMKTPASTALQTQ